jgi:hypothetical protein
MHATTIAGEGARRRFRFELFSIKTSRSLCPFAVLSGEIAEAEPQ